MRIITAKYNDGKIDEQSVWSTKVEVGHGSLTTTQKVKDIDVTIRHEEGEALPTITLLDLPKGRLAAAGG